MARQRREESKFKSDYGEVDVTKRRRQCPSSFGTARLDSRSKVVPDDSLNSV